MTIVCQKQWLALCISALMSIAMLAPLHSSQAYAESETYSITISNSTAGHTYNAYLIFDATYDNTGNVTYTINENSAWFTYVQQSELFNLYRLGATDSFTVVPDADDSEIVNWLQSITDREDLISGTSQIECAGSAAGTGASTMIFVAKPGYYYLTSSLGSTVTLTTAAPTSVVIDKGETPGFRENDGKKVYDIDAGYVDATSLTIGTSTTFRIIASVPRYDHQYAVTSYTLSDNIPAGLTLNAQTADDISVYFINNEERLDKEDINYVVDLVLPEEASASSTSFSVSIDVENSAYYPTNNDTKIVIEYRASLNNAAQPINTNTITMNWTLENGESGLGARDSADVYTYGLSLVKRAETITGQELSGAEFKLYTDTLTEEAIWLFDCGNGMYTVMCADSTPISTQNLTQTIEAGNAKIFGLKEGNYYLEETKAPTGYNPLNERTEIIVDADNADEAGYAAHADIVNSTIGMALPSAGGIGTIIFVIAGGSLIAAAIIFVIRQRMASKKRYLDNL